MASVLFHLQKIIFFRITANVQTNINGIIKLLSDKSIKKTIINTQNKSRKNIVGLISVCNIHKRAKRARRL